MRELYAWSRCVFLGRTFAFPAIVAAIARRMTAHETISFVKKRPCEPMAFDVVRPNEVVHVRKD
jgi:hypothetical protein